MWWGYTHFIFWKNDAKLWKCYERNQLRIEIILALVLLYWPNSSRPTSIAKNSRYFTTVLYSDNLIWINMSHGNRVNFIWLKYVWRNNHLLRTHLNYLSSFTGWSFIFFKCLLYSMHSECLPISERNYCKIGQLIYVHFSINLLISNWLEE